MNAPHLTADELDSFLTQSAPPLLVSHIATCTSCAQMVERDLRVVRALAILPHFDPKAGFSDSVMRGLVPHTAPAPVLAATTSPRAVAARRRAIGAVVLAGGSLAAGFVWAAAHPEAALKWSGPALQDAGHALWVSLQSVVANTTDQPWFASVRDMFATPARALLALAGAAAAYAIALTGLRRLMTEPATNAGW